MTIVIENPEKIIKKLNEAANKSDLKTFAEITKTNLNNTLQKNQSMTIKNPKWKYNVIHMTLYRAVLRHRHQ